MGKVFLKDKSKTITMVVLAVMLASITLLIVFGTSRSDAPSDQTSDTSDSSSTEMTNDDQQAESNVDTASNSGQQNNQQTPSVPFMITKVFFASAPAAPVDAGFGECSIGQQITYAATAQVTAQAAGTAQYHWEVADHLGGTVQSLEPTNLTFSQASTQNVTNSFTYIVRDTGNGTNLWNRQYINLFVTQPNEMYANMSAPVYAYKNSTEAFFVWGTYIDLC